MLHLANRVLNLVSAHEQYTRWMVVCRSVDPLNTLSLS